MAYRLPRRAQLLRFPAADGVRLEGRLAPGDGRLGVVLCHPHPLYGGSMLTPVTLTAEQAFQEVGYTTLAFNFRGVGGSEGVHGGGEAEQADVAGALGHLAATLGGDGAAIAICGYSFGAWVGGRVAAREARVAWYLGIAPPLDHYDFDFLRDARGPVGIIAGERDLFCPRARLEALVASLPVAPWLRLLPSDHFFADALPALASACLDAARSLGRRE